MNLGTLFLYIASACGSQLLITPIQKSPGIYFEELGKVELYSNEWKVVVYYDLKGLAQALRHMNKYVDQISNLCKLLNEPSFAIICNSTVAEMNYLMTDITQKYSLLRNENRSKRGLFDAFGIVSKTLFGTLNEEDAKFYDQQIDKVQRNEDHLLALIKNQTFILETTVNVFNKSQTAINRQMSALNARFAKVTTMFNELINATHDNRVFAELESLTSLTTLIIIRYQSVVNTVVDLVTDVRHGKPHPSIVTPDQLETVLTTIRKEIPNDVRLSAALKFNNLLSLYRISHTSAFISKDRIIYEFRIPLPYQENYQLYKVIPLPTVFQRALTFIQPSIDYLVIDYSKEHYYDLTSEELGNCITEDHAQYLCRIIHPLFNINSDNNLCELQLIRRKNLVPNTCNIRQANHTTIWTQLSQANKWLFSTVENLTIDVICQDEITPYTISGVAIIELEGSCHLRTQDLTLRGYNTKTTELKNFYVPPTNISEILLNFTRHSYNFTNKVALVKYAPNDDLAAISDQIRILKKEETDLPPLDKHTIHHYSLIYILLSIIAIFTVYKSCKHFLHKTRQERNSPPEPQPEETQTQRDQPIVFTYAS